MDERYGLRENDWEKIIAVIKKVTLVDEAILFGSRARGNYQPGSDIDIALKGAMLQQENIRQVSFQLNEGGELPYKFDIVNFHSISSNALLDQINSSGIVFYKRTNN